MHVAIFDAGDGEEVLDGVDQPERVVVNGVRELEPFRVLELLPTIAQHRGRPRDRGEGRPQVMADGSKQVGTQLLVFGEHGGLLPLPRRLVALEGECALADDRQDDGVLERLELASLQIDAHDAEYLVSRTYRKVEALRLWQGVSARPGVLVVVERPRRHGAFVFGEQGCTVVFGPCALIQRLSEQVAVCGVEDDVEFEELHELAHGDARSCLGSLGPL